MSASENEKIVKGFIEAKHRAGYMELPPPPQPPGPWLTRWQKLLFKLHLRNTYPTYLTGLDGSKVPANVIRTNGESFDIKPGPFVRTGQDPAKVNNHINVYTPPGEG